MEAHKLLIHSASQIVQVVKHGERMVTGAKMNNVTVLTAKDGSKGCSIVINRQGKIASIGTDREIAKEFLDTLFENEIDATGKCVLPGLVDGHTHAVWVGDRVHEFAMKLSGATYMEVHQAGGGIHFTVDHVRKATEEELYDALKPRLWQMIQAGTSVAEVKSGYGLDGDNELKMLRVIERARRELPIDVSSTYCGAHAIPRGKSAAEATDDIIQNQLPRIQQAMDRGELKVDNIDVFCEEGVFDVDQTRQILKAGRDLGLAINFHGEELCTLHSAEMGVELQARAISHLEEVSDEGIAAMARQQTVAVILPTTAYILRLRPPPVRRMIDAGVPVALGSDFNPNAPCLSMPMVMHLACVNMRMSMDESLMAATINAAASLGRSETHGSLEPGKTGDMFLIQAPRWEHLIYQFGSYQHLISHVFKNGTCVYEKK